MPAIRDFMNGAHIGDGKKLYYEGYSEGYWFKPLFLVGGTWLGINNEGLPDEWDADDWNFDWSLTPEEEEEEE